MSTKMAHEKPLISVLMGVYYRRDSTQLLKRSIQSILSQTHSNLELIICDDGSNNAAKQMIERFAVGDPRIRLTRKEDLITLSSKLNECLKQARGEFIARMDDDDYSHTNRFEKQINYLEKNRKIAFVGCNVNVFSDGQKKGTRSFPEFPQVKDFYMTQPFIHPSLIFRRGAIMSVGGYSEDPHTVLCEDYDILLRLYAQGFLGANVQELLLDYTVPKSAKGNRTMRHRFNEAITRWRRFQELGILPQTLPYVLKPIAVGMIPDFLLKKVKRIANQRKNQERP